MSKDFRGADDRTLNKFPQLMSSLSTAQYTMHDHHEQKCSIRVSFLYMLPVVVAWSCFDGNAMRHVIPVSWMTSRFHVMG